MVHALTRRAHRADGCGPIFPGGGANLALAPPGARTRSARAGIGKKLQCCASRTLPSTCPLHPLLHSVFPPARPRVWSHRPSEACWSHLPTLARGIATVYFRSANTAAGTVAIATRKHWHSTLEVGPGRAEDHEAPGERRRGGGHRIQPTYEYKRVSSHNRDAARRVRLRVLIHHARQRIHLEYL